MGTKDSFSTWVRKRVVRKGSARNGKEANVSVTVKAKALIILRKYLQENIKGWVTNDNEIKKLNDRIQELRKNRDSYSNNILNYVKI